MPGIVGLITKGPRIEAERELSRMVDSIRHEPFYITGTVVDEALGVYVGWSARKGSFCDSMPVTDTTNRVSLVFSGEEYSGKAGANGSDGHCSGPSSSGYLMQRYLERPSFLAGLNGRFHGLLIDRNLEAATLFNDRYGMHRIYYHESSAAFYFAAEAKAILAVRPELRKMDPRGLGEFVACGCVLENRTLFKDIHVLPPGSAWTFGKGGVQHRAGYFDPRQWEEQEPLTAESYYQQLREVFTDILPRYFNGREQVGMSLTGGLDTRMIMAWHKAAPDSLPCYSFGGIFRDCQDVVMARKVAAQCGQRHQVIPVGKEFLSQFAHYADRTIYLTDGCMDVSHSPDLYVNERARNIAPVRMTGNYGGEVLRRVRAFKPVEPGPGVFRPEFLAQTQLAAATYDGLLDGHPLSFAVFRQAPWHHYGLLSLEQTQVALRSPYLDNEFVRTVFRAPQSTLTDNDISLRLIADGDTALSKIRTDRGLAGDRGRLSSTIRRNVLEFTFKAEYAYDYGMPQWVAQVDNIFAPLHLERLFLGRHKFYHFRVWYRDALSDYVRQILLDSRALSRPYLQQGGVEDLISRHLSGERNYTTTIHKLLTLELIHRRFLDS